MCSFRSSLALWNLPSSAMGNQMTQGHGGQSNVGRSKNCSLLPVGKKSEDRLGKKTGSHAVLATCIAFVHVEP